MTINRKPSVGIAALTVALVLSAAERRTGKESGRAAGTWTDGDGAMYWRRHHDKAAAGEWVGKMYNDCFRQSGTEIYCKY